jgi:hypothetical protein
MFHIYVASYSSKCCIYLQWLSSVFLKCFASVLDICCNCFICFARMLQVFQLDIAKADECCTCCNAREKRRRREWSPRTVYRCDDVWTAWAPRGRAKRRRGRGRAGARADVECRAGVRQALALPFLNTLLLRILTYHISSCI